MGFLYAPRFHPAMRHVMPARREMGIPTVFNMLGPLTNPAHASFQVLGASQRPNGPACSRAPWPTWAWNALSWCTARTAWTSSPSAAPARCGKYAGEKWGVTP